MRNLIIIILLLASSSSFAQKKIVQPINTGNLNTNLLGLLIDVQKENEEVLYYNKKQIISTIGCSNCVIKARTKFETNPEQVVYLDSSEILFEKIISGVTINCISTSSFFINNAIFVTAKIKWAPIVPITIEFYEDKKLLIERDFNLKYY